MLRRHGGSHRSLQLRDQPLRSTALEIDFLTTRRKFLGQSVITAAAAFTPRAFCRVMRFGATPATPILDPNNLTPFVDPLPLPVVAQPQGYRSDPGKHGVRVPFYRVHMHAIASKLRDFPPTDQWSFGGSVPGVMFDTKSNQGMFVSGK